MRLGPLTLQSNLFLSPLAGYTNLPFRLVVREVGGAGLATTDLVNARSLLERNPKALKLIETSRMDRPLAVQLFGSAAEEMREAAAYLESLGMAAVDINMGCPVRKVCRVGGGSAMMTELDKTAVLVKGMVENTAVQSAPERLALLRLDTDWYESTRVALEVMFPRLSDNGVLIADDYGHYMGHRKAIDEYFEQTRTFPLLTRIDYSCRLAIKPSSPRL